ncbi:hydrolase [Micromonosporaceae bacterium B7E4]
MVGRVLPRVALREAAVPAVEVAARHAEDADANRTLSPQVVEALVAAGFCRHFVPTRFGGTAGRFDDLLAATTTIGAACTSAAWCGSLAAGAGRLGAFLPEEGQSELWADGPDQLVVAALNPTGSAEPVAGGWRLRGSWRYTSGVDSSDWALVCAPQPQDGQVVRYFLVPRAGYQVVDDWSPTGMRGTGSNTLVLAEAFVPHHRAFRRDDMLRGEAVGSTARCHTVPLRVASGLLFAAPALGAAHGALAAWSARAARGAAGRPGDELELARTVAEVDVAALLLRRAARVADREAVTPTEAARNPMDCALAVEYLVGAVQRMFRAAGTSGQFAREPLQRYWRDIHFLASHVALRLETVGSAYGAHLRQAAVSTDTATAGR